MTAQPQAAHRLQHVSLLIVAAVAAAVVSVVLCSGLCVMQRLGALLVDGAGAQLCSATQPAPGQSVALRHSHRGDVVALDLQDGTAADGSTINLRQSYGANGRCSHACIGTSELLQSPVINCFDHD
jgi:hypothetical protein